MPPDACARRHGQTVGRIAAAPARTMHDVPVRLMNDVTSPAKEIRMHWLWVFLIGLVVGLVAKLLTPGRDPGGFIVTALIGIAGSLLATWAGQNVFGWYQQGQSAGFIASVIGAVVLLLIYHLLRRRST
ncbi:GlsB/YeaQ/YmgE family stress response membrane protein [Rhodanobacter ginsengisoli]|uniref:GlsB/YeaQ/YmgE family stress response membrane protein n=1 Tax=Rhodanobacter ginsengisoli TaxID=418646 RepID=A0ABW0QM83_9GAMM